MNDEKNIIFFIVGLLQTKIPFCFIGTYESIVPVIQFFNINLENNKEIAFNNFIASLIFHSILFFILYLMLEEFQIKEIL